jgi:hypothetical protein
MIKKILFAKKCGENIFLRFLLKLLLVLEKNRHNIGFFLEKRQFFRRKLAEIEGKCDHNIDPLELACAFKGQCPSL